MSRRDPLNVRFWEKVRKGAPNECWLWLAGTSAGYGWIGGKTKETAHRLSWKFAFGDIPKGMWVLHKCDTPLCVNPNHLFLGTRQDNEDDKVSKNRQCFGEKNKGGNKLTENQVKEIRRCLAKGETGASLARLYNVTPSMITLIKKRKKWKYLDESNLKNFIYT